MLPCPRAALAAVLGDRGGGGGGVWPRPGGGGGGGHRRWDSECIWKTELAGFSDGWDTVGEGGEGEGGIREKSEVFGVRN